MVVEEDNEPVKRDGDRQQAEDNMKPPASAAKSVHKPDAEESEESDSEEEAFDIDESV